MILFVLKITFANNPEWIVFDTTNSEIPLNNVKSIYVDKENNIWFASSDRDTTEYLIKFESGKFHKYDFSFLNKKIHIRDIFFHENDSIWVATLDDGILSYNNNEWKQIKETDSSKLGFNTVDDIEKDSLGNFWLATGSGLVKITDSIRTYYTRDNTPIPALWVSYCKVDSKNELWMSFGFEGFGHFDGSHWEIYNSTNTPLDYNFIIFLQIDNKNNIWMINPDLLNINSPLVKFDGEDDWTIYNKENGAPSNSFLYFDFDQNNNVWTTIPKNGFAKFDGKNWETYTSSNSGLHTDSLSSIKVDELGNVWLGSTKHGLAVYREGGVILSKEDMPKYESNIHIYPNPAKNKTNIRIILKNLSFINIEILDIYGNTLKQVYKGWIETGASEFTSNMIDLPAGCYFCKITMNEKIIMKKIIKM